MKKIQAPSLELDVSISAAAALLPCLDRLDSSIDSRLNGFHILPMILVSYVSVFHTEFLEGFPAPERKRPEAQEQIVNCVGLSA